MADDSKVVPFGTRASPDPLPIDLAAEEFNKRNLDPKNPFHTAKTWLGCDPAHPMHNHRGTLYRFDGKVYRGVSVDVVRGWLYPFMAHIKPTARGVSDVLDALRAEVQCDDDLEPPFWLQTGAHVENLIPFANGLLDVTTGAFTDHTPELFNVNVLGFAYDAAAPAPELWLWFLRELWPDDAESINALQEFMGLWLGPWTKFQKGLFLIGPKRSGKGTIARVIRQMVGAHNVAAPSLMSLASPFGLAGLIGKLLAIIPDARLGGTAEERLVLERLLSLIGEDPMSVARKFKEDWVGQLRARVLLISNELPRFNDASGALASRFIVLVLRRSFFGQEDPQLTDRLLAELPGIANWTIEGLKRLMARGHLEQPASGEEAVTAFAALSSPIESFITECCVVHPAAEVAVDRLYQAWRHWCTDQGFRKASSKPVFGRDLHTARPHIRNSQPRDGDKRLSVYRGIALKSDGEPLPSPATPAKEERQGMAGDKSLFNSSRTRACKHNGVAPLPSPAVPPDLQARITAACAGLLAPEQLMSRLSAEDLEDLASGAMTDDELRRFAEHAAKNPPPTEDR